MDETTCVRHDSLFANVNDQPCLFYAHQANTIFVVSFYDTANNSSNEYNFRKSEIIIKGPNECGDSILVDRYPHLLCIRWQKWK